MQYNSGIVNKKGAQDDHRSPNSSTFRGVGDSSCRGCCGVEHQQQ
jgi:hypothetical protein